MDRIIKGVCFDKKAWVSLIDVTEGARKGPQTHDMSPLAAACYARALTVGAYINANLKNKSDRFNLIIEGNGVIGKIYIASEDGDLKGFVEEPHADLPLNNGKLDVENAVGSVGEIIVVKDLGLKEPYIGRSNLVSGNIADDYAEYLLKSEGIHSAVALSEYITKDGIQAAGGIIVEALPDAGEDVIFILEDVMTYFTSLSKMMTERSMEDIADFYFGHLKAEIFPAEPITYGCHCDKKIVGIVRSLGKKEAEDIVREQGALEVSCDYCGRKYRFDEKAIDALFKNGKDN